MGTNRGKKIYTRPKPQPHRWFAPIERVYALGSDSLRQSGYLQAHGILKIHTMVIFTCTHSGHESRKEDIYKTKTPATSLVGTHSTWVCTWIGLLATIWLLARTWNPQNTHNGNFQLHAQWARIEERRYIQDQSPSHIVGWHP